MATGIRGRLFLASIAVIVVIGIPTTFLVRSELTSTIEERVRNELGDQARAARVALLALPELDSPAAQQLVALERIDEARGVLRDGIESARMQGNSHAAGEMSELLASLGSSLS